MTIRPKKPNHSSLYQKLFQGVVFLLTLAFAALASGDIAGEIQSARAERRVTQRAIKNFTLVDQNGARFEVDKLAGKVLVVAFAYTTCVDVCPLITAALRQTQIALTPKERTEVQLLTITTDPEIDSPKVLSAYAKRYGAEFENWTFLTGDPAVLARVWKNFGVGVKRRARGLIDHTPLTAIVDQSKAMRVAYIGPSPDSHAVLDDVRSLLKQH
ncbi:MAG TPA: SCO family protein [Candidatus Binatia bacterium]|jgi:protein SCO1/2|nr:SCO family protein [Candidatus Binatia bacterium]